MHEAPVFHKGYRQDKQSSLRSVELTDDETFRLMRAFIQGNTGVLEEDMLTLVQWAHHMRMGACMLEMILDGTLIPVVEGDEVKVRLPATAPQSRAMS
jgi:hypothetical protein